MIKIIEENKSILLGICPSCLSKFTLDFEDLIYLYERSDTMGVKCPVCCENVARCDMSKVSKRKIEEILKGNNND